MLSRMFTRLPRRIQSTVYRITRTRHDSWTSPSAIDTDKKETKTLTESMGKAGCRGAAAADTKIKCSIALPCRPAFSN